MYYCNEFTDMNQVPMLCVAWQSICREHMDAPIFMPEEYTLSQSIIEQSESNYLVACKLNLRVQIHSTLMSNSRSLTKINSPEHLPQF